MACKCWHLLLCAKSNNTKGTMAKGHQWQARELTRHAATVLMGCRTLETAQLIARKALGHYISNERC